MFKFQTVCHISNCKHQNLLDCPQKCLSLLYWVSMRQETIISSIGGLVHKFSFFSCFMMNSEYLFPLPVLTHCGLSTVRSPLKRRRKKQTCEHKSTQSRTWCKVSLEDSVNLLFICKYTLFRVFPGKFIQAPTFGSYSCLPRKHVFLWASWMEYFVFRLFFHCIRWSQTAINPSTLCRL